MPAPEHVIWAYDGHILVWYRREGKSVAEIRRLLHEDCGLRVSEKSIREVIAYYDTKDALP